MKKNSKQRRQPKSKTQSPRAGKRSESLAAQVAELQAKVQELAETLNINSGVFLQAFDGYDVRLLAQRLWIEDLEIRVGSHLPDFDKKLAGYIEKASAIIEEQRKKAMEEKQSKEEAEPSSGEVVESSGEEDDGAVVFGGTT